MTSDSSLLIDRHGPVHHLVLNRPESRNGVDLHLLTALADALESLADADPAPAAVLIRGTGPTFSAGADLRRVTDPDQPAEAIMDAATRVILAILDCPLPVVCAATGRTAGVGASIALAADYTVMDPTGELVMAFTSIGLMCDGAMSALLPAAIGPQAAARLLLTGGSLTAERAFATGAIAELTPTPTPPTSLADATIALAAQRAEELAARPTAATRATKLALSATRRQLIADALAVEKRGQVPLLSDPEFLRRVEAFFRR